MTTQSAVTLNDGRVAVVVHIGAAHRRAHAALVRLHARMDGLGCSYQQLGAEIGCSYAHARRLVTDLVAVGDVTVTPGVSRSIRPAKKTAPVEGGSDWS